MARPGEIRAFSLLLVSLEQREGRVKEVRVNPGIAIAGVCIGQVIVPVSERKRAAFSGEDLYAAAEAEREVVLRRVDNGNLLCEV